MAGIKPVTVNDELLFLLKKSLQISTVTNGSFDITYAGAEKLWDFKIQPSKVPSPEGIKNALELIGYQKLVILESSSWTV